MSRDRYRIVEYSNDNENTFYIIQFQFSWLGIKFWRSLTTGSSSKSMHDRPKTFNTLKEAQEYIKSTTSRIRVVEEGVI